MEPVRVRSRAPYLWGAIAAILLAIASIFFVAAPVVAKDGDGLGAKLVMPIVITLLAVLILAWAVFGSLRFVEVGQDIWIRRGNRDRRIAWEEVAYVHADVSEGKVPTKIPFVDITTTEHDVVFYLKDGSKVSVGVGDEGQRQIMRAAGRHFVPDETAMLELMEREARSAEKEAAGDRLFNVFVGLIVFVAGGGFFVAWLPSVRNGIASSSWPTVKAESFHWHFRIERHRERGSETERFFPEAIYVYNVDVRRFEGQTVAFFPIGSSDQGEVVQRMNAIPGGKEPDVYYNPADPAVSVLIPGTTTVNEVVFAGAAVVALGGLLYAAFRFRQWRQARRSH